MNQLDNKWIEMYLDIATRASKESHAKRLQVGAVFVSKSGVMSLGINGMPSGASNNCEYFSKEYGRDRTKPEVSHAEENLITKLLKEGISSNGGTIYLTHSPCINCAKLLANSGIERIYYMNTFNKTAGIGYIKKHFTIEIIHYEKEDSKKGKTL